MEDTVKLLALSLSLIISMSLSAQDVNHGQILYKTCVQCHGEKGMGIVEQKAPRIAGQYDWYIISTINKFKQGTDRKNPTMLPFIKNLSDQDIADLAAYVSQMQ